MNVIADSMAVITTLYQTGALGIGEMRATLELRIEEDGTVTLVARDQHHTELSTFSEAHGLTLTAGTLLCRDQAVIADIDKVSDLARQLEPLVARVLPGRDSYWDGSNWIGRLEEDAWAAWTEITAFFEELEAERWTTDAAVWDAEDYISYGHDVTSQTTDAELNQLAAEYVAEAERENIYFLYGSHGEGPEAMCEILFEMRKALRADDEEDWGEEYQDLKGVISNAAQAFLASDDDAESGAVAFHVGKCHDEVWQAVFTRGPSLELGMTRIATGAQAEEFLRDPSTAAHIVFNCWDEDWTE
ncbi:hypothetical protein M3N55_12100 [Roseibaca sp. V10]|uniref:Uncharacterized protein n=1 Tax=Roseinatronobacter domitianus TaxID=2940293 RepID=A0ABT0M4A6_9RHOB|nr:hypothetical protein [Roseibaca domitiana]MCL1629473.1 hypothetical protein [Roseibaca domitiana]